MQGTDNVIHDEVIEGRMFDLIDGFFADEGLEKCPGDITIEGYMQGNDGYFYLAKYRERPICSILHYRSQLVISNYESGLTKGGSYES